MGVTQKSVGSMALPIGHLLMDIEAEAVGCTNTAEAMDIVATVTDIDPTMIHATAAITTKVITEGIIADMGFGLAARLCFDSSPD